MSAETPVADSDPRNATDGCEPFVFIDGMLDKQFVPLVEQFLGNNAWSELLDALKDRGPLQPDEIEHLMAWRGKRTAPLLVKKYQSSGKGNGNNGNESECHADRHGHA